MRLYVTLSNYEQVLGSYDGIGFLFFCEDVQKQFVHFAGMLIQEKMILHFEGFRYKKTGSVLKKLSFCSNNCSDTMLFLPSVSYNSFSAGDRRSLQWVTKFLNGLSLNSGTYPKFYYHKFETVWRADMLVYIFCASLGERVRPYVCMP